MEFDKNFIEKIVKQDQRAFNQFYLDTVDVFFRYLKSNYFLDKQECEDIISDFYIKWRDLVKKYDSKQSFTAFMWTVFKNLTKDYFKKHKDIWFSSFKNEENDNFEDQIEDEVDIITLLESDFQYQQIQNAIEQLDFDSREIVFLKFIEEKSNDEISQLLWLSKDNVRQKISRSIKKLKVLLDTDIT